MKAGADPPKSLDVVAFALLVGALALVWARWRYRDLAGDLRTAEQRVDDAHKHARAQAERIAELDSDRVAEIEHDRDELERELGEAHFELDGPAGGEADAILDEEAMREWAAEELPDEPAASSQPPAVAEDVSE